LTDPIGIKIPITMGNTGYFDQTFSSLEEAKSNLYNLILTKKGERFMQPDFGTDVYKYFFNQITDNIKSSLQKEIKESINTWIPYINVIDVNVNISDQNRDTNKIDISIKFSLKRDLNQYDEIIVSFN